MGKKTNRSIVSSAASYKQLIQRFKQYIQSGKWPAGAALPSYRQLTADMGVGIKTIRLALASLAKEQCIVKNSHNQWIVKKSDQAYSFLHGGIAFITTTWLPAFYNDFECMRLRKGIERVVTNRNKQFRLFYKTGHTQKMISEVIPGLKEAELDGILLYGHFTKNCLREYSELHIPVVRVDAPVPAGIKMASVCVDNFGAAKDAVIRMSQLGHRKIAFCRSVLLSISEVDPDSLDRQAGFLEGLKECGIKNGSPHIFSFMVADNSAMLQAIFNARPRYTAVLTVDGRIAKAIETESLKTGLILPRDLSLVAFSALGSFQKYAGPRVDFEQLGQAAVELLESREVRQVHIPTSWHNGSTLEEVPLRNRTEILK